MQYNFLTHWPSKVASALILTTSITLIQSPVRAVDPVVVQQAETSCIEQAQQKGFALQKVVYAGKADQVGKDVQIVLHLLKEGQLYKLTCYFDQASGMAEFGGDQVTLRGKFPWWWLLLPILGLPALLWWAKGRETAENATYNHLHYYDAVIRSGESIPVYSEPMIGSRVIGYVENGQIVRITDRDVYNDGIGDWVELASGGWIPKQYVGTPARV